MSAIPQIPPRPTRSHHVQSPPQEIPQIPPRPNRHLGDRSVSPELDRYARSPLHDLPLSRTATRDGDTGGLSSSSRNASSSHLPQRPPSVSLPSIGQEGNEYADVDYSAIDDTPATETALSEPVEKRNVAGDLPLHAPKPSFSDSTAKNRVSTVTRTDSTQAAAAGIGKATTPTIIPDDSVSPHEHLSKHKAALRSDSAFSAERPSSAMTDEEHGIPEIGQRVPMYPDAGDVQAPSPAPVQSQFPVGIGFHNSGATKPHRHHRRTPSGREILPPGSYGMHGHGLQAADHFERDWYAKHPDALQREEHGEYGPGIGGGRGEWAMSSEDLNKLVYDTARASHVDPGLPNEQMGYKASEEYASRLQSPTHAPLRMMHPNSSQPHVESPLRKASFPIDTEAAATLQKTRSMAENKRSSDIALESETEDEGFHINPPSIRWSKYTGGGNESPKENLGPQGGNTEAEGGIIEERGYGVPILASDEVSKTPGAEYMQPAIFPAPERRGSGYYSAGEGEYISGFHRAGSRSGSAANSRPSSRPGSIHSISGLLRLNTQEDERDSMHTPLEDVDEYEPLFSDEEGNKQRKPLTVAERLKLREQMKRFPSQDIWEDTPNSLQLEATVDTPEAVAAQAAAPKQTTTTTFETAEQEAARKGEPSEAEKAKLLPAGERLAKSRFQPHIREEMDRPSMRHRFPSRDIWEDSPDSAQLETTVGEKPADDLVSPTNAGIEAGAVVQTSGRPKDGVNMGEQPRENATAGAAAVEKPSVPPRPTKYKVPPPPTDETKEAQAAPTIPARPTKKVYQVPPADAQVPVAPSKVAQEAKQVSPTDRKAPIIPDRPKPQIPSRPNKPAGQEVSDSAPLQKVTSTSSTKSEEQSDKDIASSKPKPAIPARPTGSKIANLKAGFLGDLESRLKLGPQGPKPVEKKEVEPEIEEEKAPLSDARKGRAKGPSKRKPISTAAAVAETSAAPTAAQWGIQSAWTVWETDGSGTVAVSPPTAKKPSASLESLAATETAPPSQSIPADPVTAAESPAPADDIQNAKAAVREALHAEHLPPRERIDPPLATDLATPGSERERNPLSQDPPTPVTSPPSKVVSADSVTEPGPQPGAVPSAHAAVDSSKQETEAPVKTADHTHAAASEGVFGP